MQDTMRALERLRDVTAEIQRGIVDLEQIGRTLMTLERGEEARADPLIGRSAGDIEKRIAAALERQTSIARALEQSAGELRSRRDMA